jgi:non-canonical (house-cleaning) NTP pyrophosphatase
MIIAIATKRGPKVEAAQSVFTRVRNHLIPKSEAVEFLKYDVEGGMSMPRSLDELMSGAQHRVVTLQRILADESKHADFLLGMEGGFHTNWHNGHEQVYLQSWAYVSDGKAGYFGSSGNVLVPDIIANKVMHHGQDLGEVIDAVMNQRDVRSKQGTWGILTRDLVSRKESFEFALLAAFAPFYNKDLYSM